VLSTQGKDRGRWRRYIDALPADKRDVFFLPEYAALWEAETHQPAFLFRFGDDKNEALMVAERRSVATLPFCGSAAGAAGADYYDIASPYGYGGPVVHCQDQNNEPDLFIAFREAIHEYCLKNGIVAEFLRLHPMMQNHQLFGQDPGLHQKNSTVWIDLRQGESEILQSMKRDHRYSVKTATKRGVEAVRSDLRQDHLKEFHRLYSASMDRRQALPLYYFSLDFFQELAGRLPEYTTLFLAIWNGKAISGHLYLRCGPYVDYYLSGSDSEHWDLKANVLTIYKTALWAKAQGHHFLHLGGGHACELDSVFEFKSHFSPNRAPYYMYRQVHDRAAYARLCAMKQEHDAHEAVRGGRETGKDPLFTDYFPAYRG
jgi:hypothetical protein